MQLKLASRSKYLLYLIDHYKNIPSILSFRLFKTPLTLLKLKNGIIIHGHKNSNILTVTDEVFFQNLYTHKKAKTKKGDVVVDIGAHVGIFTLLALNQGAKHVYAFEPDKKNIEMIERNIDENNYQNASIFNAAVSNRVGKVKLYIAPISSGNSLYQKAWNKEEKNYISVPSFTLEKIIKENNLKQIDLLKIDCEGSEGDIVASTSSNIWKKIQKIVMEFHDNVSSMQHTEIEKRLRKEGFTTELIYDGKSPYGYLYCWKDNN